jgi:hypothetical protein
MTADELRLALAKDGFKPCRLHLKDGQEIHVLSANNYGLSQESGLLFTADLREIAAADVERIEPLPYRVIDEDLADLARARQALQEIRRRDLIPWAELPRLLGLGGQGGPAEGGGT